MNEREKRESERKEERRKGTEGRIKERKEKRNERTEWIIYVAQINLGCHNYSKLIWDLGFGIWDYSNLIVI